MHEKIVILDFGSQYTQLIARRVRQFNVFCEILPYNAQISASKKIKGVIFSGSPFSVHDKNAPLPNFDWQHAQFPVLGICYGAQIITKTDGGLIEKARIREYGRAQLIANNNHSIWQNVQQQSQVWMSHADTITQLGQNYAAIAKTADIPVAAFSHTKNPVFGLQFHPEVYHTEMGKQILENFVINICGCAADWTPKSFVEETIHALKEKIGTQKVVMGLSGGVDSTVAALLLHNAIGKQLYCIFVNNGLLRKNEYKDVLEQYKDFGLNIKGVDKSQAFYNKLDGVSDPEKKRKIIGATFIEVFDAEAKEVSNVRWLGQGTIYPDVIESVSVNGPSVTIKSHHNVGGLPKKMRLKVVEPLRMLFKDEVRNVGKTLHIPDSLLGRHPFPGPGLAIRILGDITLSKVKILQEADYIYTSALKEFNLYDKIWQAGAILLPVNTVGVMGDERTYENAVCLRAVTSVDGMTADFAHLPNEFLAAVSGRIINKVKGINRVVYDISSKPPATIEWE